MSTSPHLTTAVGPPELHEVSNGVFAYIQPDGTWWITNMGVLVGTKHTIAIDTTSTESRTRAFQQAIAGLTHNPVQTLINTHHHGDHTNGNYLFDTATIVAHELCREAILAEGKEGIERTQSAGIFANPDGGPDWGHIEPAPPFLTYTAGITVHVDDLRCEVAYTGTPAHTTNDSIIWLPERGVLFAGDLIFNGGTPFLLMGSVAGALEAVTDLKRYDAETIVPGHGAVAGPELIDDVLDYLTFVMDLAKRGHGAGIPPLELAQDIDLGKFSNLSDPERIVGNLHRAYLELGGSGTRRRNRHPQRPPRHDYLQRRAAAHLPRITTRYQIHQSFAISAGNIFPGILSSDATDLGLLKQMKGQNCG